jgi:fatty acid desaturase
LRSWRRAGSFIHEVAHFRHQKMRSFYWGWNLMFGIPLLMPSWFYICHLGHHNGHLYGTRDDGEYLPLASGKWGPLVEFFIQVPLMPLWVIVRFLLGPITFLSPRLRRWVLEHASSFKINFRAPLEIPKNAPLGQWAAMELACSALIWSLVLGMMFGWPLVVGPVEVVLVAIGVLTLNYLRTLVAHRYRSTGGEMSFSEQLDDSINIEGYPLITEVVFPIGLRYHALHHLFPSIPYHNLGTAHRRLMAQLPEDSPYRRTVFRNTFTAIKSLWTDFRAVRRAATNA